jgi:hypothetical protein
MDPQGGAWRSHAATAVRTGKDAWPGQGVSAKCTTERETGQSNAAPHRSGLRIVGVDWATYAMASMMDRMTADPITTRPRSALRAGALVAHVAVAASGLFVLGFIVLGLVRLMTGQLDDPHGFATGMLIALTIVVPGPVVVYLWLVRRWWKSGRWIALAMANLAYAAFAFEVLPDDRVYGPRSWLVVGLAGMAALGAVLVMIDRRRG